MAEINEELIFTIEYIIDKGNSFVTNLTEISVYKLLFLTYLKLKDEQIDIKLPYSWYLHGVMIERDGFFRTTRLNLSRYFRENNSAINYSLKSHNLNIPEEIKLKICRVVDSLLEQFMYKDMNQKINKTKLIREVYEYAPFEFQKQFKYNLLELKLDETSPQKLVSVLDDLKRVFPAKEYDDIYLTYLWWDDTLRLAAEIGAPTSEKQDLIKNFWQLFAAKLRSMENENISQKEIESFVYSFKQELSSFSLDDLLKRRKDYLLRFEPPPLTPYEESLIKELNEVVYNQALRYGDN